MRRLPGRHRPWWPRSISPLERSVGPLERGNNVRNREGIEYGCYTRGDVPVLQGFACAAERYR
jgi:hypothetical protein